MRLLILISLLFSSTLWSQHGVKLLYEELPSDSLPALDVKHHSSVQPSIRWSQQQYGGHLLKIKAKKNPEGHLLGINPIAEALISYENGFQFRNALGIAVESNFAKKWYFRMNAIGGLGKQDSIFSFQPFYSAQKSNFYQYVDVTGRVSYTPNKIFNFQIGNDHNSFGEGARSLFLSDYGKPVPFAKIDARFWRLDYTVLYQLMSESTFSNYRSKFATTHHISLNITKWLNVGVFESVIFQPKDTALRRGFDVEYLNPVIFFRPQEYSIGSADNVLLGLSLSAKWKKQTFYSQLLLDEFSLNELKAKSGWWANKYAIQAGVKGIIGKDKVPFFYRLEYNFARPYTYSHLNDMANYGNSGTVLAHPLGANFHELLGEVKCSYKDFLFKAFISYSLQGLDQNGASFGGNIYQPYTLRPSEYGNFAGQGLKNNAFRAILSAHWTISKYGNLQLFTEQHLRFDTWNQRFNFIPVIGLRSKIRNDYRNY
ncbi:MAG: hypothetical protein V4638_09320 [Bacteroidota bacterium]